MRRLRPRVAQSVLLERAIGGGPAQAKAQWTAMRAGEQMVPPPPQELASAARPEWPMQVGRAIPARVIRPQTIRVQTIRRWVIPARTMVWSVKTMRTVLAAAGLAQPLAVEARMLEQPCRVEELQLLTDRPSIRWADRAVALRIARRRVWLSVALLASGLLD
jgi:hypothetical protein